LTEKTKKSLLETLAFTPEGIEEMNKNIIGVRNKGKFHQFLEEFR
jgi:hypothetical protein